MPPREDVPVIQVGSLSISLTQGWESGFPKNKKHILALAASVPNPGSDVLPPLGLCGEARWSALLAALRARPELIAEAASLLEERFGDLQLVETSDSFRFYAPKGTTVTKAEMTAVETAAKKLTDALGPWTTSRAKQTVVLCPLGRMQGMTAPDGPIFLNLSLFQESRTSVRTALAAHQLFHKFQYAQGFRKQSPRGSFAWFSEGTAVWAEYLAAKVVCRPEYVATAWSIPEIGLFESSYYAFPFWLNYAGRARGATRMVEMFRKCAGDPGRLRAEAAAEIREVALDGLVRRQQGNWFDGAAPAGPMGEIPVKSRPKMLGAGPVAMRGWLPELGADLYTVKSSGSRSALEVKIQEGDVTVIPLTRNGATFAVVGNKAGGYSFTVGGAAPAPVPAPVKVVKIGEQGGWTVSLDGVGNVLLERRGGSARLGFRLDGFSSMAEGALLPGGFSGKTCLVGLQTGGSAVHRGVTLGASENGGLLLQIKTVVPGGLSELQSLIRRNDIGSDGGPQPPGCDPIQERCMPEIDPVDPRKFTINGRSFAPSSVVVPENSAVVLSIPLRPTKGLRELIEILEVKPAL